MFEHLFSIQWCLLGRFMRYSLRVIDGKKEQKFW